MAEGRMGVVHAADIPSSARVESPVAEHISTGKDPLMQLLTAANVDKLGRRNGDEGMWPVKRLALTSMVARLASVVVGLEMLRRDGKGQ